MVSGILLGCVASSFLGLIELSAPFHKHNSLIIQMGKVPEGTKNMWQGLGSRHAYSLVGETSWRRMEKEKATEQLSLSYYSGKLCAYK